MTTSLDEPASIASLPPPVHPLSQPPHPQVPDIVRDVLRARVHLKEPGPLGLRGRRLPRLLPARKAHGQCDYRIVPRKTSGRMPERELVLVIGGRPGQNQHMAYRLQRVQTTFVAGEQDAQRICPNRPGSPGLFICRDAHLMPGTVFGEPSSSETLT